MARPERFELPTTKFVAWYSIQLSYGRIVRNVFHAFPGAMFGIFKSPARPSMAGHSSGKRYIQYLLLFPSRPTELRAHCITFTFSKKKRDYPGVACNCQRKGLPCTSLPIHPFNSGDRDCARDIPVARPCGQPSADQIGYPADLSNPPTGFDIPL